MNKYHEKCSIVDLITLNFIEKCKINNTMANMLKCTMYETQFETFVFGYTL